MSSLQYLEVVFCFLSLTELARFSILSFVSWSFQVLGRYFMDFETSSGKSLSLGIPKAPQGNIQGQPRAYAWGCPGRHPLFRLRSSVTLLGAIFLFTTWYVFCLERHFIFFSFSCCLNKIPRSEILKWESLHIVTYLFNFSLIFTYIFRSSLSFTRVLYLYPMSK